MNNNKTFFITRTAILLAMALAVQFTLLRLFPGNPMIVYIVGSLLNMIFFISAMSVGILGGAFIGMMTPIVAFLTGHLGFPVLIPFVAFANIMLIVIFYLITKVLKDNYPMMVASGVIASVVKFAIMMLSAKFILPLISSLPAPAVSKIAAGWSIPQLVTALIGLGLALAVKISLRKTDILEIRK